VITTIITYNRWCIDLHAKKRIRIKGPEPLLTSQAYFLYFCSTFCETRMFWKMNTRRILNWNSS